MDKMLTKKRIYLAIISEYDSNGSGKTAKISFFGLLISLEDYF